MRLPSEPLIQVPPIRPIPIILLLAGLAGPTFGADLLIVHVVDAVSGEALGDVEVQVVPDREPGAVSRTSYTNDEGTTRLRLAPGRWRLTLRQGDFAHAQRTVTIGDHPDTLSVRLRRVLYHLPEQVARAVAEPVPAGVTAISVAEVARAPAPAPDPVRLLRALPGVATAGDLATSAYHVRGGSFDENLVLIEGIAFDAPLMLRNGLAETLSPVNGDLVERMDFHAGVLPATFADRLSGALDVAYQRPDSLSLAFRTGTARQTATVSARQGNLRWAAGLRQADLGRVASRLQTRGEIEPAYRDGQALATWQTGSAQAALFAGSARSELSLAPQFTHVRNKCSDYRPPRGERVRCGLVGDASGLERFDYDTDWIGLRLARHIGGARVAWHGSWQRRQEREETDRLLVADWSPASRLQDITDEWITTHQVIDGRLEQHRLEQTLVLGSPSADGWSVGAGWHRTELTAERTATDSLWLEGRLLAPAAAPFAELVAIDTAPEDWFSFAQIGWHPAGWESRWESRVLHVGASDEWLVLPRGRLQRLTGRWRVSMAAGLSAQPPAYRQFLAGDGHLTQKGADGFVEIEHQRDRWRLRATAFARAGWDRISWTRDDMEIRYASTNDSDTRIVGAEAMLRGQVGRAVGLVSYSWLRAEEDIDGDGHGYLPMASDQRHTATAYLEDQMSLRLGWIRASRFHLRLLYGSGFPYTPLLPVVEEDVIVGFQHGERHSLRDDEYIRFDIGMTQVFAIAGLEIEVREEVANLFDEFNALGFQQLPTPDGEMALLPRGLGRRVYNGEITVRF